MKRCGQLAQEPCGQPWALMAELQRLLHSIPRKFWSLWEKWSSCCGSLPHSLDSFFCVYSSISPCTFYMLGVKTYKYFKNHFSKDYNLVTLCACQYFESSFTLDRISTLINTQEKEEEKERKMGRNCEPIIQCIEIAIFV